MIYQLCEYIGLITIMASTITMMLKELKNLTDLFNQKNLQSGFVITYDESTLT